MTQTIQAEFCTMSDIGLKITGEDAQPIADQLNEYLKVFAKPVRVGEGNAIQGSSVCIKCGKPTGGFLGTFTWGMTHGEGYCGNCNWPARGYHRPKDENGEEIFEGPLEYVLQYHPDNVRLSDDTDA